MRRIRRAPRLLVWIAAALAVLAVAAFALRAPIRDAMYGVTGEEDLREQVKGTAAWALLQLSRPPLQTAPLTPMAHTGVSPFGVNTFLEQEVEPAKVEQSLRMIADAGFHWVRQEFPWEDIEIHARGDFQDRRNDPPRSAWDKYDRIVALAQQYGLEIIARLDHPPAWTRADGNARGAFCPPDDLSDYAAFVRAVVSRYQGRIHYYQIWNEPNIYPEWGEQSVDPEGYVALLKVGYAAARAADPGCVVLSAGLAQTTEPGGRNMDDLVFLQRMYDACVRGYFDVMGVMAYGLWTGPTDRRASPDRTNFARPQLIREIMVRNGDADKPIWATEVGWNAVPVDSGLAPVYGRVSLDQQARYAVEAYQRAQAEWPWMGVMSYWFFKRATDTETGQGFYYFRMVEPDFSPLPVYNALSALAQEPARVQAGAHQEDHWAMTYSGEWTDLRDADAMLGGAKRGGGAARVEFTFVGTDLDLVIRRAPDSGSLRVLVDGRAVEVVGRSDRPEWGVTAPVVRALRPGEHRVVINAEPGAVIDGLIVQSRPLAWLGRRGLGPAAALAALAGLLLIPFTVRRRA